MDAFLQPKSIELIENITGVQNIQIIDNKYQPQKDSRVNIYRGGYTKCRTTLKKSIEKALNNKEKVSSFITACSAAEEIADYMKKQFPSKKIIILHGKNNKADY